jgi:hypothetical protein
LLTEQLVQGGQIQVQGQRLAVFSSFWRYWNLNVQHCDPCLPYNGLKVNATMPAVMIFFSSKLIIKWDMTIITKIDFIEKFSCNIFKQFKLNKKYI